MFCHMPHIIYIYDKTMSLSMRLIVYFIYFLKVYHIKNVLRINKVMSILNEGLSFFNADRLI